jgi:hypothetical protein
MTTQLHAELAALVDRLFKADLTDEEWALLQVHMAYCDSCETTFLERKELPSVEKAEGADSPD